MLKGTLIETKNGKQTVYHNATTTLFNRLILGEGIGTIISSNQAENIGIPKNTTPQRNVSSNSNYGYSNDYINNTLCLYLLNLTEEEKTALQTTNNKTLPFIKNGVIDNSKIVGYAKANYNATVEKEGSLKVVGGKIALTPDIFGIGFKWEAGKLNGTYNTMVLGVSKDSFENCFACEKKISYGNTLLGETSTGSYYLAPNVKKADSTYLTQSSEILVGDGSTPKRARKVIDFANNTITELAVGDVRYGIQLYDKPHQALRNGAIILQDSSTVKIINVENGATIKNINYIKGYILTSNHYLTKTDSSTVTLKAYNRETDAAEGASDVTLTTNLLSGSLGDYYISNYGQNYVLWNSDGHGIEFSDYNNIDSSYVSGFITDDTTETGFCGSESNVDNYMIFGVSRYSVKESANDGNFNPSGVKSSVPRKALCVRTPESTGQILSYAFPAAPVTIAENEGYEIDYYFAI